MDKKMTAKKEGRYIVFYFDDGKNVKYDLATGKTYGKSGREVKSISSQLSGCNLLQTIESFEDKKYRKFLEFLDKNFINKSKATVNSGFGYIESKRRVNRYTNIGSFLAHIGEYSRFEQFFSAGIEDISPEFKKNINEVPKGLLKICRENKIELDNILYEEYIKRPDDVAWALTYDFNSLEKQEVMQIITEREKYRYQYTFHNKFEMLVDWGWGYRATLKYIDRLMTLEALSYNILSEVYDYANMMRVITPRYEKYPRNFLTTHKIATRNYNRLKKQFDEKIFEEIKKTGKQMEYKNDDKYVMLYPNTTEEIKEEGVRQNHCVASYIQNVLDGYCHIMFLRLKETPEENLVTIEIRNNKVVQARGKYNRDCTKDENDFIKKFEGYLARKEKKND